MTRMIRIMMMIAAIEAPPIPSVCLMERLNELLDTCDLFVDLCRDLHLLFRPL